MEGNGRSSVEPGDKAVAIYHVVYAHEGFEESAQALCVPTNTVDGMRAP